LFFSLAFPVNQDSFRLGTFEQQKYVVLRSFVVGPQLSSLYRYGLKRSDLGPTEWEKRNTDPEAPPTPASYADPMMDMLLTKLLPKVEQATTLKLYPTFSFYRIYQRGDLLPKHRDRPACEIALTLALGYKGTHSWPIWIEGPDGATGIDLEPGDAVVYRGIDCPHWRDAFDGEHAAQVFLFYVDQNGPYLEWKYDKREKLASFLAKLA